MASSTDPAADHWKSILVELCTYFPQAKARLGALYPEEYETLYPERQSLPQPSPAKKRKIDDILASAAPPKLDTCKFCKKDFDVALNKIGDSCQWHSGEKELYEEGLFWHEKGVKDPCDVMNNPMFSEGFMWSCCNTAGNSRGCQISKHVGVGAATPSKERGNMEPNTTPKRKTPSTPSKVGRSGSMMESKTTPKQGMLTPSKHRRGSLFNDTTTPKYKAVDITPSSKKQRSQGPERDSDNEMEVTATKSPMSFKDIIFPGQATPTKSKINIKVTTKNPTEPVANEEKNDFTRSTCQYCYEDFDPANNSDTACRYYHPGKKEVDYEDPNDFWADYSEKVYGQMVDQVSNPKYAKGFIWDCCEDRGDSEGCKMGPHKATETPLPLSVKRRLTMVRGNVFGSSPLGQKSGVRRPSGGLTMDDPINLD